MTQVKLAPNKRYPSLPDTENVSELLQLVRESLEVGERRAGSVLDSFVRVRDLQDIGVINVDEDSGIVVDPDNDSIFPWRTREASITGDWTFSGTVDFTDATVIGFSGGLSESDNATITGNWEFDGQLEVGTGHTEGNPLRLYGNDTGDANSCWMGFYDNANTRQGYIGIGSGSVDDFYVNADTGALRLQYEGTQGILIEGNMAFRGDDTWLRLNNNGDFTSGVYTPNAMRIDDRLDGNQFVSTLDGAPGSDTIHYSPVVASRNSNAANETGYVRIRMASGNVNTSTMMSFVIRGYNYASSDGDGGPWAVVVGGYPYTSNWNNTRVVPLYGAPPFNRVQVGETATDKYVLLGTSTTNWNYPQIAVTDLMCGFANQTAWFDNDWNIDISSSLPSGWSADNTYYIGGQIRFNEGEAQSDDYYVGGAVHIGSSAPASAQNGDIWFDTS